MHATDSHRNPSAPGLVIDAVLFCSFFTFLFLGSPPSPFLLNGFLSLLESQSLSPACLEQLEWLWTEGTDTEQDWTGHWEDLKLQEEQPGCLTCDAES